MIGSLLQQVKERLGFKPTSKSRLTEMRDMLTSRIFLEMRNDELVQES